MGSQLQKGTGISLDDFKGPDWERHGGKNIYSRAMLTWKNYEELHNNKINLEFMQHDPQNILHNFRMSLLSQRWDQLTLVSITCYCI